MSKEAFLKLYACCVPVRGACRSVICDLQRFNFFFIPNALFQLLTETPRLSYLFVEENFSTEEQEIIQEYISFLEENELAFWVSEEEYDKFPPLSMEWDSPYEISNAILDVDQIDVVGANNVLGQLSDLGCYAVEVRFYRNTTEAELLKIIEAIEGSRILNITFYFPYSAEIDTEELVLAYPRISRMICYNAPQEVRIDFGMGVQILHVTKVIVPELHCGHIAPKFFTPNLSVFTEAIHYNTCLNRKIAIDKFGNIKNCPSTSRSFGHIETTPLKEVVDNPEFTKLWLIKKDEVAICKDCEFRYICTDCRAYLEDPADMYSKPLKCGYNPYTCEWEEWSTNPLKQKAMALYGMELPIADRGLPEIQ